MIVDCSVSRTQDARAEQTESVDRERFASLINQLKHHSKRLGIPAADPSPQVFEFFFALAPARRCEVIREFERTILDCATYELEAKQEKFTFKQEIGSLRKFLSGAKLKLAGGYDISDFAKEDEVVEVYSLSHTQIFRSWSCFNYCSYSLADLLVYDWTTLYERPQWVVQRILEELEPLIKGQIDFVEHQIPPYILRERLPGHCNVIHMDMKYIARLVDVDSDEIRGFIAVTAATLEPIDPSKIAFI